MANLNCPKGCESGWANATQTVKAGRPVQKATCRGCGTKVKSRGGVEMGSVQSMTQDRR
jgi:hypothetical protein